MIPKRFNVDVLAALFQKAPHAEGRDTFRLLPVLGTLNLGRADRGELSVLLELDGRPQPAIVEYAGLRLQLFEEAEIRTGRRNRSAALGVLSCLDESLKHNFCILVADMCELLRTSALELRTSQQFREYVARWANIFSPGRQLTDEAELGLWGELEVLGSMRSPEVVIPHWHGPEAKTFDFGGHDTYVEVKTSTTEDVHHFGLSQTASPTTKSELFVASVFVVDDPASGRSLDDQVEHVRARLSAPLQFDTKLARLGYRPGVCTARYSCVSFRYVAGVDIPRPRQIDHGVSDVRFVANLSKRKAAPAKNLGAALKRLST